MKIRAGFVSNSSSSSFTFIGASFNSKTFSEFDMKDALSRFNREVTENEDIKNIFFEELRSGRFGFDYRADEDGYIVGYLVSRVDSDDGYREHKVDISEMINKITKIKDNLNKFFGKETELKIISFIEAT